MVPPHSERHIIPFPPNHPWDRYRTLTNFDVEGSTHLLVKKIILVNIGIGQHWHRHRLHRWWYHYRWWWSIFLREHLRWQTLLPCSTVDDQITSRSMDSIVSCSEMVILLSLKWVHGSDQSIFSSSLSTLTASSFIRIDGGHGRISDIEFVIDVEGISYSRDLRFHPGDMRNIGLDTLFFLKHWVVWNHWWWGRL